MKQLIEFRINDGDVEYVDHGIYDKKYSDEEIMCNFWFGDDSNIKDFEDEKNKGMYWDGSRLISISTRKDISEDHIKILNNYGVAYEYSI